MRRTLVSSVLLILPPLARHYVSLVCRFLKACKVNTLDIDLSSVILSVTLSTGRRSAMESIDCLVSRGTNVKARAEDNSTPFHFTARNGYLFAVETY